MRIAIVHSFYRRDAPSGENVVVLRQAEALRGAGHEVQIVARHTDDEATSWTYPLRTAMTVATGRGVDPTGILLDFMPDVVHVHNLFPNFGTRWLADWDGPLVATLHNFRSLCANGLLFRDGAVCTDCISGTSFNAVRHACYRNSRFATAPLAVRNRPGLAHDPLVRRADRVIVLSEHARRVYTDAHHALEPRLAVLPNGLEDRWHNDETVRSGWVFVGRISREKGLDALLRYWPAGERLTVVGDGPQRAELQEMSPVAVRWLGAVDEHRVDEALRRSLGLVFPGVSIEGATPLVAIESLMNATPIVALRDSAAADLVTTAGCGLVYDGPQDLASALNAVRGAGDPLHAAAREAYLGGFTLDAWVERLESLYLNVGRG